ncbi:WD repeat domain-containing protein 83 [Zancudomyces culisetae]|uniref:WD repeat domain-containing protein 83 n=1 Tax=Zancudomyces culisetae TaxID=1213189 RepID=A0A1R1PNP3_ZANCU|nr:WD repeat domain-containing protein 83 [Zancudomyces culisetae]|eukprot:OMH82561.1 WD repeat domain-containing protein 83 [Zancudomyces culisetae]
MEPHAYWSNLKHKIKPHKEGAVNIVAFDNSGDYLFSGGQDKRIILLNSNSGKVITSYEGHGREVLDVCVSVCLWDIEKGEIPQTKSHA